MSIWNSDWTNARFLFCYWCLEVCACVFIFLLITWNCFFFFYFDIDIKVSSFSSHSAIPLHTHTHTIFSFFFKSNSSLSTIFTMRIAATSLASVVWFNKTTYKSWFLPSQMNYYANPFATHTHTQDSRNGARKRDEVTLVASAKNVAVNCYFWNIQ